jgi:hypothetical protein
VNGFINFVIPMLLYLAAVKHSKNEDPIDPSSSSDIVTEEEGIPRELGNDGNEFMVLPKQVNARVCAMVLTALITAMLFIVIGVNIAKAAGSNFIV